MAEALADAGVEAVEVKGSVHSKTKALDSMQEVGGPRVILLNLADESASGANLTLCNHAIFVHPMLVESQQIYTACETQAIGKSKSWFKISPLDGAYLIFQFLPIQVLPPTRSDYKDR